MKKAPLLLSLLLLVNIQDASALESPLKFWKLSGKNAPVLTTEEEYQLGVKALEKKNFNEARKHFELVVRRVPLSEIGKEATFYLAVTYFELKELDFAKEAFTAYLKNQTSGNHIQETLEYKFQIAEAYRKGAKKRLFGSGLLPNIVSGEETAFEIYDEIISTFPAHELAAQSLFAKAELHWSSLEFLEAVESYQTLIRRFPRHERALESYLMIGRLYVHQSSVEKHNSDLLALAEINLRKFEYDFPGEERLVEAKENVRLVKEHYAGGLYQMGEFYERVSKPKASLVYYKNAIQQFPDTEHAARARARLAELGEEVALGETP